MERSPGLDHLRILAGVSVVFLHVSGFAFRAFEGEFTRLWWTGNLVNSATRWVVPVFVMISGSILLRRRNEPAGEFYRHRAARIVPPLLFWTVAYAAFARWIHHRPVTAETLFRAAFVDADPFYHLWFLYLIVGLYAVTPLLRPWVSSAPPGRIAAAAAVAFAPFLTLPGYSGWAGSFAGWLSFVPYVGYYLLGAALAARARPVRPVWSGTLAVVAIVATIAGTRWLVGRHGLEGGRGFQDNLGPLTIAAAVGLFEWIRGTAGRPWLGRAQGAAAGAVFGVYLLHPFFIEVFWKAGLTVGPGDPPVAVVAASLAALGASGACAWILGRTPFARRLV